MVLTILAGSVAVALLTLVGFANLSGLAAERRRVVAAAVGYTREGDLPLIERLQRWFRRTRPGSYVERELRLAGIGHRPLTVVAVATVVGLGVAFVLWTALAPIFGLLGLGTGVLGVRFYLRRAKERRLEAFILQMPELARVLANATNAGLSIGTAIAIASEELVHPAGTELQQVSDALRFGTDLETALDDMGNRLPSREVAVLLSTLVVCAKSGGSLVSSLRDIADTLEGRKETRREIRTTLAQSLATGYMIISLGFAMLFLLNAVQPGSVEKMTEHIVGQIALVVSGTLFLSGYLMIRKMARFDI
ncbi:type II secretion system F family protein [Nocardioides gilvus]|uniref:type II secretion system F family protein n=1 Tax=Nocardioides gilvus TaxID=1735589 RepID=UPI000D74E0DD|nr:type II secretion system F family protein [Nocardioides gilvus]